MRNKKTSLKRVAIIALEFILISLFSHMPFNGNIRARIKGMLLKYLGGRQRVDEGKKKRREKLA